MIRYIVSKISCFPVCKKFYFTKNGTKLRKDRVFKSQYRGPRNRPKNPNHIKWLFIPIVVLALFIVLWNIPQEEQNTTEHTLLFLDSPTMETNEIVIQSAEMSICLTEKEYELLARVVTAEAEDQGFKAQYWVACVIMNRVESDLFPDKLEDVIWQNEPVEQFTSMWNGRFERCRTTEECYEAVDYLIEHGIVLPDDVLYFSSNGYLFDTIPYMQINQLYFSRQKS